MHVIKTVLPLFVLPLAASAQWLDYPTKGIPRATDAKADLTAPAPRTTDGRPDIMGLWVADNSRHLANLAADLKEVPFQPWAEKLYNERRAGRQG